MTSTLTPPPGTDLADVAPLQNALLTVFDDAIGWRQPVVYGCCTEDDMCGDHQADEDRATAMKTLVNALMEADGDDAALGVLRGASRELLREIAGATEDNELAAVITGDGTPGTQNGPQISPAGRAEAPPPSR